MKRRHFLTGLAALPVATIALKIAGSESLPTQLPLKSTHVMHDEVADMRVGDRMINGRIVDSARYVLGFNDTLRARHQHELTVWLRKLVDDETYKVLTS